MQYDRYIQIDMHMFGTNLLSLTPKKLKNLCSFCCSENKWFEASSLHVWKIHMLRHNSVVNNKFRALARTTFDHTKTWLFYIFVTLTENVQKICKPPEFKTLVLHLNFETCFTFWLIIHLEYLLHNKKG